MAGAGPARRGSDLTALAHRRRLVVLIAPSCAVEHHKDHEPRADRGRSPRAGPSCLMGLD
jgi:hypothetical protein